MFQNHALFLVSCNQHLSEAKEYPQNEPWPLGLVPNIIAETYSSIVSSFLETLNLVQLGMLPL